jgi:hypothetical protein
MRELQKGMSMNFMQVIAYRQGAKLLLMLGLFAVLSLAFTAFGPDQALDVIGNLATETPDASGNINTIR